MTPRIIQPLPRWSKRLFVVLWVTSLLLIAALIGYAIVLNRELTSLTNAAKSRLTPTNIQRIKTFAERHHSSAPPDGQTWLAHDPDMPPEISELSPSWAQMRPNELYLMLIGGHVGLWLRLERQNDSSLWQARAGLDNKEFPLPSNSLD